MIYKPTKASPGTKKIVIVIILLLLCIYTAVTPKSPRQGVTAAQETRRTK